MPNGKNCLKSYIVLFQVLLLFVLTGMLVSDFKDSIPLAFCLLFTVISIIGYIVEQELVIQLHIIFHFICIAAFVVWSGFHFARILDATHWYSAKIESLVLIDTPFFITLLLYAYCCCEFREAVISEKSAPIRYHHVKNAEFKAILDFLKVVVVAVQLSAMIIVAVHLLVYYTLNKNVLFIEQIVLFYLMISFAGFVTDDPHIMAVHDWLNGLALVGDCFWIGYSYERLVAKLSLSKTFSHQVEINFFLEHSIIFFALLVYSALCRILVKNISQPAVQSHKTETVVDV